MICPKCNYARQEYDADVLDGVCPACGIAYGKWLQAQAAVAADATVAGTADPEAVKPDEPAPESAWQRFYLYTCFMPSDRHESALWGHIVIFICFAFWGLRFIVNGVDWAYTGSSFMHSVNLPFHEYGHLMFSPFGEFWMILGGSLFQILLPLFPLLAFMVLQRDNFAASIMLWWSGQNFIDIAPYIADAPVRAIPLISGNDDSHDWWNLLSMSGSLEHSDAYATLCFVAGVVVILLSNFWSGHLLWIEFRGRTGIG